MYNKRCAREEACLAPVSLVSFFETSEDDTTLDTHLQTLYAMVRLLFLKGPPTPLYGSSVNAPSLSPCQTFLPLSVLRFPAVGDEKRRILPKIENEGKSCE